MAAARNEGKPPVVILYDVDCGFCRWSIAKILGWDRSGRLRPLAIQHPHAEPLLAGVEPEQRMASWHLVPAEGERYSGGAVLAVLMRLLPGGRPLAVAAARAPRAVECAYRFTAAHRTSISRLVPAAAKRRADRRIERRQGPDDGDVLRRAVAGEGIGASCGGVDVAR